ncbi:MBL fold metallo-hydrolase [Rhodoferax sp. TS-BS-61-7]|uniref:MBL fold metallo-hydrolase n=1 Tax=Rhodoferax sp. TS-BS-61-7 TaxID=2094194 RepID=UPI000CF60C53|nr:MBL fold metallo-hydrolase [Rhodoferax sp. TS-BS-61-7]PQA77699.1 MBL fold metallo-hydrolase [Rhodoferax sp. TS-BS-61-7]
MAVLLPPGVTVFERGWLSSNNILIQGEGGSALIDSGYCTHADQTLALVDSALQGSPLDLLLNTHLHSDHCGGNAALQARYPALQTHIPPGHAEYVRVWDAHALSYTPTGQNCPRFHLDATLQPGTTMRLGDLLWQVHAAPGHDPHSVILFEPASRTLVSADALWERGFGVVFPELDGEGAFDEVAATLDLIERLNPAAVIPGHGAAFADAPAAIAFARQRLNGFVQNPAKHLQYAAKVLLKFKLLEAQRLEMAALLGWARGTPYFAAMLATHFAGQSFEAAAGHLVQDLVRSGAATVQGSLVLNA